MSSIKIPYTAYQYSKKATLLSRTKNVLTYCMIMLALCVTLLALAFSSEGALIFVIAAIIVLVVYFKWLLPWLNEKEAKFAKEDYIKFVLQQINIEKEGPPCPVCGKTSPAGSVSCNHCGYAWPQKDISEQGKAPAERSCPGCGRFSPKTDITCKYCGYSWDRKDVIAWTE